ncbi:MAG: isoprenoid biosynthesis glyoxalase ElbB [Tepidisphaera sp.]|nr:isoprenoid biosynthesis glyoxalase ElbB [Tepidisphaera sp.]
MSTYALVLCGSGRADGSEIHESVSILIHLARLGIPVKMFAPDAPQAEVINHLTGKPAPSGQTRNMLVEAARIARGAIAPLSQLDPAQHGALLFAGGFGAAKNLCTFAQPGEKGGPNCDVLPDVERVIKGFHAAKKPIGLCCIAPVLAARVLGTRKGGPGVRVTLGAEGEAADAVRTMGATHVAKAVTEAFTDDRERVVTTPAYMYDANPYEIFTGIGAMVEGVAALANKQTW